MERCENILKKLTIDPIVKDDFINQNLSLADYINEIIKSFEEISNKIFVVNLEQDTNPFQITKSIELIYGIRNFIGNANKFANKKVYVTVKSDSENSEIIIEDDGPGYPKDVINKIGEPYNKSQIKEFSTKSGLGLGIFIGKTLLEKNLANLIFRNSETRTGAEVNIAWNNKDLKRI